MEDPYFIVKTDVERALENLTKLHESYQRLTTSSSPNNNKEKAEVRGEIKTALRDVQYDIEDIEETVRIVEANPKKFKISTGEIESRKNFITNSKDRLSSIEGAVKNAKTVYASSNNSSSTGSDQKKTATKAIKGGRSGSNNVKYSKLQSYQDEENEKFIGNTITEQQQLLERQDEEVEKVSTSIGVLKSMSRQIGDELDHQNEALDDLQHDMDSTASKMDNVMKKLAKVTRLSDDKRQWTAIMILSVIIIVLFILLLVL